MIPNEFKQLISGDPALATPPAQGSRRHSAAHQGAASAAPASWRGKFHAWVDEQQRKHGLDPEATEATGEALVRELEAITDGAAQKAWERLAELLRKEK